MLRFGPERGPVVVVALPLFEEANRTRAFAVAILRALAARGIAGVLPDLPGQGESAVETQDMRLPRLRAAFAEAASSFGNEVKIYTASLRSGALLDIDADVTGRWRLAPQDGPSLVRELKRMTWDRTEAGWSTDLIEIAGNVIHPDLIRQLEGAHPEASGIATRVARLSDDPRPADITFSGKPLWRQAEPGYESELLQSVTSDIANWVGTCEGC